MADNSEPIPIKLITVGGKTCVVLSYTEKKFPEEYEPTILETKQCMVSIDNKAIDLAIWDTAGQEQFQQMRGFAYPNADVFIIVFSVVDQPSFDNAIKVWYPELQEICPHVAKVFVGNKVDKRIETQSTDKNAPVLKETAQKIISDLGCEYVECSALSQVGLNQVFETAIKAAIKQKVQNGQLDNNNGGKKGKKDKKDKNGKKKKHCTLI